MELDLINYCFSARTNISNIRIALFKVPIKINEIAINAYNYYEKYD